MKRRTFLQVMGAAVAAAVAGIGPARSEAERGPSMFEPAMDQIRAIAIGKSPAGMKHLYDNGEGEVVAANSLEEAAHHLDVEMAGLDPAEAAERLKDWYQIPDEAVLEVRADCADAGDPPRQTAGLWAAECSEPVQVFSTYC